MYAGTAFHWGNEFGYRVKNMESIFDLVIHCIRETKM